MTHSKAWRIVCAVVSGLGGVAVPNVGLAEYHLAPGDVIEVNVVTIPDLRQRAQIDTEGEISLPYLGELQAAGRTISAVRAEIRRLLPGIAVRRQMADRVDPDIALIKPEEITVQIAQYRPIYV